MTPKTIRSMHTCGPFRNGRCVRCLRVQGIDTADPSGSGRDTSSESAGAGSQGSAKPKAEHTPAERGMIGALNLATERANRAEAMIQVLLAGKASSLTSATCRCAEPGCPGALAGMDPAAIPALIEAARLSLPAVSFAVSELEGAVGHEAELTKFRKAHNDLRDALKRVGQ